MAYHEYAVPSSGSSTPFADWIQVRLDAHPAWEFVETILDGSALRFDVYRNTGNSKSVPFFMVFRTQQGTSWGPAIAVGEIWNNAAKTLDGYTPASTAHTPDSTNLYRIPSSPQTLNAASNGVIFYGPVVQTSGVRQYYVWWNEDTFFLQSSWDNARIIAGVVTNTWNPTIDPMPLIVHSTNTNTGRTTREPQGGAISSFQANVASLLSLPGGKEPLSNSYLFGPLVGQSRNGGAWRGLFHNDLKIGAALTIGDRIQVDGFEHVALGSGFVAIPGVLYG